MSGFGAFENDFQQGNSFTEEDPAAAFLAREQDELAGLDDAGYVDFNGDNHSGYDDLADDLAEAAITNGYPEANQNHIAQEHSQPPIAKPPREEPEKIKKWREEQRVRLEQKDVEEEKKKLELRESAKHELDEWYKHHAEQIEKTRSHNRNAEKEYITDRDSDVPGQEWERIAKLCDFNPKSSKNSKDVSRMRSIILQLKQTPSGGATNCK